MAGRWDEALQIAAEVDEGGVTDTGGYVLMVEIANLHAVRGEAEEARRCLNVAPTLTESDDVQDRAMYEVCRGAVAYAEGDAPSALEASAQAITMVLDGGLGSFHEVVRRALPILLDAAVSIGQLAEAKPIVDRLGQRSRGELPPFLRVELQRGRALLAAGAADGATEADLDSVVATLGELGYPYHAAVAQLDLAEVLDRRGRHDEARELALEASGSLGQLGAERALRRARRLLDAHGDASESALVTDGQR